MNAPLNSQQHFAPNWDPNWNWLSTGQPPDPEQLARTLMANRRYTPTQSSPLFDSEELARILGVSRIIGYLEDGTPITHQTRFTLEQCRGGTEIRVLIRDYGVGIYHYGILVKSRGELRVIHATRDSGVIETSLADFVGSAEQVEVMRTPASAEHARSILATARVNFDVAWQWSANCEDFVNFCYTGQKGSVQRNQFYVVCGVAFALGGLALANRHQ